MSCQKGTMSSRKSAAPQAQQQLLLLKLVGAVLILVADGGEGKREFGQFHWIEIRSDWCRWTRRMAIDDLAKPPRTVGRQDVSSFAAIRSRPVRRLESTGGLGSGRGLESVMHNRAVLGSATKMRKTPPPFW